VSLNSEERKEKGKGDKKKRQGKAPINWHWRIEENADVTNVHNRFRTDNIERKECGLEAWKWEESSKRS